MSWQLEASRVRAIVWKDLTAERRTKANFNAVVFFAALTLLLFGFATGPNPERQREIAGGILWLTILFSGVLAFNRSYEQELEGGALDVLLLYPGERRSIFLGKLVANLGFIALVELILVPTAALLYQLPFGNAPLALISVLALGSFGFVTLGTFYAAMASRVRAREVLLPLLLFPMLVPLLVGAVEATSALLGPGGDVMGNSGSWIRLLIVFDLIFLVATVLVFDYVIED
ncbi:MAG: heme exporter protein CcmB [Gemmatimonadota bacterium]